MTRIFTPQSLAEISRRWRRALILGLSALLAAAVASAAAAPSDDQPQANQVGVAEPDGANNEEGVAEP